MNPLNLAQDPALKLSWRIGLPQWESDEAFAALCALLAEYRGIVHEVALFETITHHLYIPLPDYAARMELAARRLDALRHMGIGSVGINVLCTIGHVNEAWSYLPPLPFQPMIGLDGAASTGCACPNTPEMRAYVKAKYQLVAGAGPDFVWVDDDIRMHHHGVEWGCFCPTCLQIFNVSCGQPYSREALAQAFNQPEQGALRALWIEQNIATLESLLMDVRHAVQGSGPNIALGKMTCGPAWTTYSGQALERWFTALGATKGRPGGGFYSDATPMTMYGKAVECGWQRTSLPPSVTDIQYELENFPYQRLKKSATALVAECTLALGYGLNGIAFNLLGMLAGGYEDARPSLERIAPAQELWQQWVSHTAGLPTQGWWPAWSSQLMARRQVRPGEKWPAGSGNYNVAQPFVLGEIGLPLAADAPGNCTVLSGRTVEAFDDATLKQFLSGGLLLDGSALLVLQERGLGHLTGVRLAERLDNGLVEQYTHDPLNGMAAGRKRDARIEFWGDARGLADVLEPLAPGVRTLATLHDYYGAPHGVCSTAYENELGGRVVVAGYAPWIFVHSVAKRHQLQNIADWLSPGGLPVRVHEAVPLLSVVRSDGQRSGIVLVNAGLDSIDEVTLSLRLPAQNARLLAIGQPEHLLPPGQLVTLKGIEPWGVRVLLMG